MSSGFMKPLDTSVGVHSDEVLADADGDVAAVAIHVGALPQAAAHVADLQFQLVNFRRIEERLEFGLGAFGRDRPGGTGAAGTDPVLPGRRPGGAHRGLEFAQEIARGRRQEGVGRQGVASLRPCLKQFFNSRTLMTCFHLNGE